MFLLNYVNFKELHHIRIHFSMKNVKFIRIIIIYHFLTSPSVLKLSTLHGGCRGRDCMVVGFTSSCAIGDYHTKVVSSNPVHGEVYSIQHYVIKLKYCCPWH